MTDQETGPLFQKLFQSAYQKCFEKALNEPMTEAESKLLSVEIEAKTGLVIGFKSLKNFSKFLFGEQPSKTENPSLATLDTLARYVLKAPITTEAERKRSEDYYPYWHLYRKEHSKPATVGYHMALWVVVIMVLALAGITGLSLLYSPAGDLSFVDDFEEVSEGALERNGWILVNCSDRLFWDRRSVEEGVLTLYTLPGDNWPDTLSLPLKIQNMLLRPIDEACFEAEIQLLDFLPGERWQQAGILLLEDSSFSGKSLRLSLAFNDFFGGYQSPAEVIVQGIISNGRNNPEEFLHKHLFQLDSGSLARATQNMRFSALKIEKRQEQYRFLLANGASNNVAFREVGRHSFQMDARYVGIFALKGNVDQSSIIPARFDLFRIQKVKCE